MKLGQSSRNYVFLDKSILENSEEEDNKETGGLFGKDIKGDGDFTQANGNEEKKAI